MALNPGMTYAKAVEKSKIPDPRAMVPGDILSGLPSNGLHSNGYSLARKVPFEIGRLKIRQRVADLEMSLGEELLKPTRIYAKMIESLFSWT
jgi:phosphoribosylformylglycinamidine cyclo-ligase